MRRIAYFKSGKNQSFVDYEIFDGYKCVFSGVSGNGKSTINAAEGIIKAIAETEKVPLKFYDLQTHKGYDYFKPGEYSFDLLIITNQNDPEVVRWVPERLFREALEVFKEHIGSNPRPRS